MEGGEGTDVCVKEYWFFTIGQQRKDVKLLR